MSPHIQNRTTLALVAALTAAALSGAALAAPDQVQIEMVRRATEAKQALARAQAARGTERDRMIDEHMAFTRTLLDQMRRAQPAAGLSAAQQREWVDEHLRLMQELLQQMDEMHQLMRSPAAR